MSKDTSDKAKAQNLVKMALSASFVFDAEPGDLRPAESVLSWLNANARVGRSPEEVQRHLGVLRDRVDGDSLARRAERKGVDLRRLRMPPHYVREFGLSTFEFDQSLLSVDIFNAGNELDLGECAVRNAVEVFRVDGKDVATFVNVAKGVFDATESHFLFGGPGFSVESYTQLCWRARRARKPAPAPWDLLWPLVGTERTYPDSTLAVLPVTQVIRCRRGIVVQTFDDLWTGYQDRYRAAAEALGMKTFW